MILAETEQRINEYLKGITLEMRTYNFASLPHIITVLGIN